MSTPCSTAGGSADGSSGSGGAAPAARLNEAAAKIAATMLMILPIDPHAPPRVNEAGTTIPHGPQQFAIGCCTRISRAALRAGASASRLGVETALAAHGRRPFAGAWRSLATLPPGRRYKA